MICMEGICTSYLLIGGLQTSGLGDGQLGLFFLWEASFGINWLDMRMLVSVIHKIGRNLPANIISA